MIKKERVYLDYAATTPVDPRVLDAMLPFFSDEFGNPSSVHFFGQKTEAVIEEARETVASILNSTPEEIIFTSCGTESDNLALRGAALARKAARGANHILTTPVEHHAVLHTVQQLKSYFGFDVELLPVDAYGRVNPLDVSKQINSKTAMVSVIYANNEIGTINPISEIGAICKARGVWFHSDAVQAAAHLSMDVQADNLDMLSIGAHKFYGPKGVGVLYVRKGVELLPTQTGGGQESGLRSGTQNVPYIVGLATALRLAEDERQNRNVFFVELRDLIIRTVLEQIPGSILTGHPTERLSNHASFVFKNVDGNSLVTLLDAAGFACSSGSACKVGDPKPSEVLEAVGVMPEWVLGSLRVTLGKNTTREEINRFLGVLPDLVNRAQMSV